MKRLILLLVWLYRQLLLLYPSSFQALYAEEMEEVYQRRLETEARGNGWRVLLHFLCEVRDLPVSLLGAYRRQHAKRNLARYAGMAMYVDSGRGFTLQRGFDFAKATTLRVVMIGFALWVAVLVYQNWVLACRPHCAGADVRGAVLFRPYFVADPEMGLHMRLREVDFRNAQLDGVDLRGGFLRMSNLSGASLTYATLRHADFAFAQMQQADLSHADLVHANFHRVDLRDASLVGADLRQASFDDADLRGADLTDANLTGALYSRQTQWPENFDQAAAGAKLQHSLFQLTLWPYGDIPCPACR